jgi:hypothetical protein
MFDRFERPIKIICLAMAALLVWQLAGLILHSDPLSKLKIPALPALTAATNEPAKLARKGTNAVNGTNVANGTNAANGTNGAIGTNMANATNAVNGTNAAGATNASSGPPGGMPPEMMAQMMGGGMPGGFGGMKKIELPPDVQARVDRIIDSEILGPVIRPVPMALVGIADEEAFIQATNGQISSVKIDGEAGGIKLLRIGINRVLVEQNGEKKELTLFGGLGGESLLPPPTNAPSANLPSTNSNASTNQTLSPNQKETR